MHIKVASFCVSVLFSSLCLAQDPFSLNNQKQSFGMSSFMQENGTTTISLLSSDPKITGIVTMPDGILNKYEYPDTSTVFGDLKTLNLMKPNDFGYVLDICTKAKKDSRKYYKMYQASSMGTLFLTIVNPIAGLACAIPSSLTPPKIENMGLSDIDMLQEDIYFQTYRKEALRVKNRKIWTNFGIGFGINVGITFGLLALLL
ncbi:MAG: hypothetical protein LBQ31_02325 [Bacteroidales bacterium]|jgi:hypothetical protein|nr:hypothetical protein [Bacteroidales bacterium]